MCKLFEQINVTGLAPHLLVHPRKQSDRDFWLVIITDVTVLPRTWAVYKLMNFLMESICPQQSDRQYC